MTVQTAEPMSYPGFGQIIPGSRTVLSVAPVRFRMAVNRARMVDGVLQPGDVEYVLEPAPRDGYSVCKIHDTFQFMRDFTSVNEFNPGGDIRPMPVTAERETHAFIQHCIGGNMGARSGVHPGVIECAGPEPTPEEIAKAREIHTVYARWMVNDGHAKFGRGELKEINEEHRRNAEWLGVNVPWKVELEQVQVKKCAACAEEIKSEALNCKHCSVFLPDFYKKAGLEPDTDMAVQAYLLRKQQAQPFPVKQ